jgi:hypothetical protein
MITPLPGANQPVKNIGGQLFFGRHSKVDTSPTLIAFVYSLIG